MRPTIRFALQVWMIAVVMLCALVSIFWSGSVVLGPSACHLSFFNDEFHISAGEGRLIVCRFVSQIDGAGNVVPEVTDCRTYRGEPPIVHCIAGNAKYKSSKEVSDLEVQ